MFKIEISDKLDSHVQVTSFEFITLHVNKCIKNFRNLFHLKIYVRKIANIETKKPQNQLTQRKKSGRTIRVQWIMYKKFVTKTLRLQLQPEKFSFIDSLASFISDTLKLTFGFLLTVHFFCIFGHVPGIMKCFPSTSESCN